MALKILQILNFFFYYSDASLNFFPLQRIKTAVCFFGDQSRIISTWELLR